MLTQPEILNAVSKLQTDLAIVTDQAARGDIAAALNGLSTITEALETLLEKSAGRDD